MTTRARDFKFAGAIVQSGLYLVMVALTKNRLSAQYGWFCHGRSHIITVEPLNKLKEDINLTLITSMILYPSHVQN